MRLLLLDTCGATGSLALAENGRVVCERTLSPRAASAHLVSAIREELATLGWPLRTLRAITVVNGPGSFTGVRVGLAAAKGMCEVASVALVTVSRLQVLLSADIATAESLAVLDAGRGEFYVRSAENTEERLMTRTELLRLAVNRQVLPGDEKSFLSLEEVGPVLILLSAAHALRIAMARLDAGAENVDTAEANYVRSARALYASGRSTSEPSRTT